MTTRGAVFSIIVPTRNRAASLTRCLQSLVAQEYPRDHYEIIVIDDGGDAPITDLRQSFVDQCCLRIETQSHAGPAAARNRGAAAARGDLLAFLDDDCAADPGWLSALATVQAASPGLMLGGRTVNRLDDNHYAGASQVLVAYLYDYYGRDPSGARFFASNNMAVPRDRFRALGGFDSSFTRAAAEDRDFCDRWLGCGNAMRYVPEAVIYHAHALTLRTFWRQHCDYGRGAWQYRVRRAQRGKAPVRVEDATFYLGILRYPFASVPAGGALPMAALLLLSQVANAAGFLLERRASRR
jgi:GT2 family glycosyltransferase